RYRGERQGDVRVCPRNNWPETNVGASLLAMRRAGGAGSTHHRKNQGRHLAALTQTVPAHATALFVPRDIEVSAKGTCASAPGITGPKQM
ncbi:hypothetical protein E4L40_15625, partial [Pseudomonas putida]